MTSLLNRRVITAAAVMAALLVLGGINIYKKATWVEPWDGVVWEPRNGRPTAVQVDPNSEAYLRAGLRKGDVLYSINKTIVRNKADIAKSLWAAAGLDQRVNYEINRGGVNLFPNFYLQKHGVGLIYFYLALIGLTTLTVSVVVFFNSRRQLSFPYIYFYLLSLAFYSFSVFSPTGRLDALDMLFYALDKAAFLFFPPLLVHFFLIFPQRRHFLKEHRSTVFLVYAPGSALLLSRLAFHLPFTAGLDAADLLRFLDTLERLELLHFALFALAAWGVVAFGARKAPTALVRKQLGLIVYGLGTGTVPFTVFYAAPFLFGRVPTTLAQLTVLLVALIPLTFAYSVSRYRLMDFEILLKKATTLVFSFFAIASFYVIVATRTKLFAASRINIAVVGVLAIILGATLFTPLKKLFQALLDRAIYKRRYPYRKTLLFISKELGRERDLGHLSRSLLEAIANALSLRSIALLLAEEGNPAAFQVLSQRGEALDLPRRVVFEEPLLRQLMERDALSYYSFEDRKELQRHLEKLTALGVFHVLPLRIEDKLVGCLAMGRKLDGTYLTADDWELLATISSSAALALENAYLYSRESVRALEMQRLKDYSENIIESLTVGVAVLDEAGKIIGWNRVLEDTFGRAKADALGQGLGEALGPANAAALFPPDTQADFRLLSEISLETRGGEKRIFDIGRTPLLDNRLNPYGTIIVFEDITEKISLQQQLLTSEKLASIGLLSAGVAHEINTPLTGISSYIQMLQKKLTDGPYAPLLGKIEAQTDRVGRIIKNLLAFARNPADTAFQRVDLKASLEEIVSLIDYKLRDMNIALELRLDPLPPATAQGERLQQVFINIILNALDAMPQGGSLRIELAAQGPEAVIRIADSGQGIKPEHLPHIFDPFFTTKGVGKGTGLGLSISYAIIQEHNGRILVDSAPGRGTTFTIVIPTDQERRPPESRPPQRT